MKYVIGRRGSKNANEVGFFTPYYYISNDNKPEYLGNNERHSSFPNKGSIIITKGYYELVDNFSFPEFFLLEIELSPQYEETIPSSVRYQSYDGNSKTAEKLPLLIKRNFSLNEPIILPYSDHTYVYIEDGEYIYGPISIYQTGKYDDIERFEYSIDPLNTVDLEIGDNFNSVIFKYKKTQLEHNIVENLYGSENGKEFHVFNTKWIVKNLTPDEYILNENDEQIIEWGYTAFPDAYPKGDDNRWLTVNSGEDQVARLRFERLIALRDKTSSWLSFVDSYINTIYIKSEQGSERVNQYITDNKDTLLFEFEKKSRSELNEKLREEQDNLNTLKQTAAIEHEKLQSLRDDIVKISEEREMLFSKSEELRTIENQISDKTKMLQGLVNLENVHEEYNRFQTTLITLRNDVDKQTIKLSELKNEYINVAKEGTHQKMVELMPYVKALSGYIPEEPKKMESSIFNDKLLSNCKYDSIDLEHYFLAARDFLAANKRDVTEIEIANVLTCINQNFLTVFCGLPGVGKSSLARLLSAFCCPSGLPLEIPVGRGWSSRKNLLGFFNSLKSEYQHDEFGLLERLKVIESDEKLLKEVPFFVTLDEANLSPIEHYWSDFLGVSDQAFDRSIFVNDHKNNNKIKLPDGLRFLLTVNSDHTTETLSPRLLDRGVIIKLDYDLHKAIEGSPFQTVVAPTDFPFYSFDRIITAFVPENATLNQAERRILSDIVNIMADKDPKLGNQIPVSPRKLKSISLYCTVIRRFYSKFQDNQFLSLDYAIAQNILPLINGTGRGFENRLQKLKGEFSKRSLFKSADETEDILVRGKEFQNYSYFQ